MTFALLVALMLLGIALGVLLLGGVIALITFKPWRKG